MGITQADLDSGWLLTVRCLFHLILRLCLWGLHLSAALVPVVSVFFSNLNPFLCSFVFRFGKKKKKTRLFPFENGRGKKQNEPGSCSDNPGGILKPLCYNNPFMFEIFIGPLPGHHRKGNLNWCPLSCSGGQKGTCLHVKMVLDLGTTGNDCANPDKLFYPRKRTG